ncbi:MAG: hypothetical protein AAF386_07520 [Pseudomonadota bacterium]
MLAMVSYPAFDPNAGSA